MVMIQYLALLLLPEVAGVVVMAVLMMVGPAALAVAGTMAIMMGIKMVLVIHHQLLLYRAMLEVSVVYLQTPLGLLEAVVEQVRLVRRQKDRIVVPMAVMVAMV